jgi:hypothetical protein
MPTHFVIGTALVASALLCLAPAALANHGPGTSGGGSYTVSGEVLKQGKFDLTLREDFTQFEKIKSAEAERRAEKAGEFDALEDAYLTSFSIAYGVTDELQVGATIGYYSGHNFIDAESEDGGPAESSDGDPEGLTDLNLNAKLRIYRGPMGNLAILGGVIAPVGNNDQRLASGELLEFSSQPGTGAWAFQLGVGYSRFLTSQLTTDLGAVYTLRTEYQGFKVGDRLDLGVALAYRLTPSIRQFPNWSVFGEANAVWIGKDHSDEEGDNPNSGGWTIYLTPGVRVRLNEQVAFTFAASLPVSQDLNGDQIESRFKLAAALSFAF